MMTDRTQDNPATLRALGEKMLVSNHLLEACKYLDRALALEPGNAEIWYLKGAAAEALGNKEQAIHAFKCSAKLSPQRPEAWFHLGVNLAQTDRFDDAAQAFEQAVAHRPDWALAWLNLGGALSSGGKAEPSLKAWRQVLSLEPDNAQALYNCGCYYQSGGRPDRAAEFFEQAVRYAPDMVSAHLNLGISLMCLDQVEAAEPYLQRAVVLDPANFKSWCALAEAHGRIGRVNEAVVAYKRAQAIEPDNYLPHFKIARLLAGRWQLDAAMEHGIKAQALQPENSKVVAALHEMSRHGCHWALADETGRHLDRLTEHELEEDKTVSEWPLLSLWRHADPERNYKVASNRSRSLLPHGNHPVFTHRPRRNRNRLRVGYLSGDFKAHAIAHHIRGLLRTHDRDRFRIYGYATNLSDHSDYREALAGACDRFVPIDIMDDRQAARKIFEDRIDILVDLNGHTQGHRMGVLAMRPAPVQVGYLGFLGTTGAPFLDYFITDKIATPPEYAHWFSEKLIYMPGCYQVNDDAMAIAEDAYERREFGLPETGVVYCCFNQPYKIDRRTFDCWMKILEQVPHSVLWLLEHNQTASSNLKKHTVSAGIDPGRLHFSRPLRIDLHLARLRLADVALDTFGYNGGATTANALWAGVPMIAMLGTHMVSRMSASALHAIELPELVADSPAAYCEKAIALGREPSKLKRMRSRLAENRLKAPLFDTRKFTRHLESAYETIIDRFDNGLLPAPLEVAQSDAAGSVEADGADQHDLTHMAQIAQMHIQNNDLRAAEDIYRQMTEKAPETAQFHYMLGLVKAEQQQWAAALKQFQRASDLDAGNAAIKRNLGDALQALNQLEAACRAYRDALRIAPDTTDTLINLGNAHYKISRFESARRCFMRALELDPNNVVALNNLGKDCYDRQEIDKAVKWYERALAVDPAYAEARFNRAAAMLLQGDYERGWPEYEWRFKRKTAASVYPHTLSSPRWDGRSYADARLLVHCEQGLGDVLNFARFLPQVKALGGTLVLEVQSSLAPLLQDMPAVDELVVFSGKNPPTVAHDMHISLLSLPLLLNTTLDRIPAKVPYLKAHPNKSDRWRRRLPEGKLKVGLVWAGSDVDPRRACLLEMWRSWWSPGDIRFFSLQKGPAARQLETLQADQPITPLGDELIDFSETAAAIENMDLIISVDTAVAHLAGAMGKPVWVLLPFASDWRWLLHRSDSPWYPTARLFRQSRSGDWADVVNTVATELTGLARTVQKNAGMPASLVHKGGAACA